MNELPRIIYTAIVTDTGETQTHEVEDVTEFVGQLMMNIELSELAFQRELDMSQQVDPVTDRMTIKLTWKDNGQQYMLITADKVPDGPKH